MIIRLLGLLLAVAATAVTAPLVLPDPQAAPEVRLAGAAALAAPPPPPGTPAPVPISPAGALANYNLSSSSYAIARRFVLPADLTIDRWYFAENGEGADCIDGRTGYGAGNGGTHYGRIVAVDPGTGLPTGQVLASEKVNACVAYQRAKDEFGLRDRHQVQYVEFPPVTLEADTMYAFVLSNTDPNPGDGASGPVGNHMSPNLNVADLDDMGPHGRNTLDPAAPGAAYGVDPRETTMWSEDSGATWRFGDAVGWYDRDDGNGLMWPVGYRVAGGENVAHGWVFLNWPDEDSASVTFTALADSVLLEAGGASSEDNVGVITVENLDTGVSAKTGALRTGLVAGALDQPVPVTQGQRYTVSTEGTVDIGSSDSWDRVFDFTDPRSVHELSTCPHCSVVTDRPMLYAAPTMHGPGPAVGAEPGTDWLPLIVAAVALAAVAVAAGVLLVRRRRTGR